MSDKYDLALQGVEKTFGLNKVVSDVNLAVEKGEFISLLGPSGCGKSTTLMMIAGFEDATHGQILIRGNRIDLLPAERRNIGIVFQSYALFPHMTVWKNVEYGLKMRHVSATERQQRVERILRMVHMFDFAQRLPSALSGGQQQRVALARALVIEPDLLLLDEPFSALDRSLREELQREVRRLQKALNITTIFVTHDQEEALLMSDRIAVMKQGHIEQCATPSVLYRQPETRFVAGFIGRGTFLPARALAVDPEQDTLSPRRFATNVGEVSIPAINVKNAPNDASASVFFRPEDVRGTSGGKDDLHFAGVIRMLYFQGASTFADIAVDGVDELLLVNVSGMNLQGELREGTQVALSLSPAAIRVFAAH